MRGRARGAAATSILLLSLPAPGLAGNPVVAGTERRSPIVAVVDEVAPAVVNIATDQRVTNPFFGNSPFSRLFEDFFGEPRQAPSKKYVQNSLGSGVLIDPAGYVATNDHVIQGASRIRVTLRGGQTVLADIVGTDADSDLAVLKLDGKAPFPSVRLGRSNDLMIGETVIAIGNPYGFSSSVTTGVVSALDRSIEVGDRVLTDFIQTDALINPGNSGGPLLNIRGELIGVNNAVYAPAQGIGFAIPVDRVRRVVDDLIHYGEVRHPWLGFLVEEYAPEDDDGSLNAPRALRIARVFSGSPAERAGLRPGDRVRSLEGRAVRSRAEFDTVMQGLSLGRPVSLETERAGQASSAVVSGSAFPEEKALTWFAEATGLQVADLPAGARGRYAPERGVAVTAVRGNSRAERIGLAEGDVLVRINGAPLGGTKDLRELVPRLLERPSFFVVVVRGRVAYNVTFRIA